MKKFIKVTMLSLIGLSLVGCKSTSKVVKDVVVPTQQESTNQTTPTQTDNSNVLQVDACDLSGNRKPNVKVDVGYGDRVYWAYTNATGQLVKVEASEITVQKNGETKTENKGRYCPDEAKVPGTERSDLDEGHAIADSIGGVSNAYNITPQDSFLNRKGKQYKMEDDIRNSIKSGKKVTDFVYLIEYTNEKDTIPTKYKVSYKVEGEYKSFSFENKKE